MYQKKRPLPSKRGGIYHIEKELYDAVTSALKIVNKPGLITWGIRESAKVATTDPSLSIDKIVSAVYGQRDSAADIGTMLHHVAEDKVLGRRVEVDKITPSVQPYVKALLAFFDEVKPKVLHTETTVFHKEHKFAGTLDLMVELHNNTTWILDFKTGKNIYPESGLQQAAYKNATHLKLRDGTIIPMPKVDKTGIVHLKPDTSFSFIEVNEPFEVFLHILKVYRWAVERGLM
jgi:hypothetical protein